MDNRHMEPPASSQARYYEQYGQAGNTADQEHRGQYDQSGYTGQTGYRGQYDQPGPGQAITLQPMHQSQVIPGGALQGIGSLASVEQLEFHKENDLFYQQFYNIFNSTEHKVGIVLEEPVPSDDCCSLILLPNRGFKVHVVDSYGQIMFVLKRNFQSCSGCACCADGCCYFPNYVFDGSGQKLGMVRWMQTRWKARFGIFDPDEQLLYDLWSPACFGCGDINFPIRNVKDGTQVGNLAKIFPLGQSFYAGAYRVNFDMNIDVRHKAMMIATVFAIDANLFEKQTKK